MDTEVAHAPPPNRSAYATAKNAQFGLALSWALELASRGITVDTVAPGFIPVEGQAYLVDASSLTRWSRTKRWAKPAFSIEPANMGWNGG